MIVLYTTGCPKCVILKAMLDEKGIEYETNTDIEKMISLGIKMAPVLEVDGKLMGFDKATEWVDEK